jgi:hypothetical protein
MDKTPLVFARGFVGFKNDSTVIENNTVDLQVVIQNAKFNRNEKPQEPLVYDTQVQDLWERAQGSHKLLDLPAFQEEIIKTAFNAFNCKSFMVWTKTQMTNNHFTAMHKRFLNETLSLISFGKPRTINVTTWSGLLNKKIATNEDKQIPFSISEFFNSDTVSLNTIHSDDTSINSIENAVLNWIKNSNGYSDLLTTLYILFGKP